jgi:Skp family chaperone for outer membrane proteins
VKKSKLGTLIGLAGLAAAIFVGSYLWAQQRNPAPPAGTAPAAAPLRTPVRIVNLTHVVKKYNRWLNFQQEYKNKYKVEYEEKINKLKAQMDGYAAKLQNPQTPAAEKDAAEKEARKINSQMRDIGEDAKQTLGKMEADMIVTIYKEVEREVQHFARASSIELVLHYNDATEESELSSPANITRKISYGGCVPLFAAPGMDISEQIVAQLNARVPLRASSAGAPPPTPGPGIGTAAPGTMPHGVPPGGIVPTGHVPPGQPPQQQPPYQPPPIRKQ